MRSSILVNKNNKFRESFLKHINLISVKNIYDEDILIEENTYKAYLLLANKLKNNDIIIGIDNAYRSVSEQQILYKKYAEEYDVSYRDKYVAIPGCSEHHTGLAIDISINIDGKWLSEDEMLVFSDEVLSILHNTLHKFGFILRYPSDKEDITGISYESWHIRYVGNVLSNIIYENNWSLEEYYKYFGGVLIVNKAQNMTSRDVVNEISNVFGLKKIGHTGTLDPMAEGVLVVTMGTANKIAELLTASYKEYIAGVELGVLTDTLDIWGNVIKTEKVLDNLDILTCVNSFKKKYLQEVPIYSAIKINGRKLYDYARSGTLVDLPKREVEISDIELLESSKKTFKFRCVVSKGTYIRSLIRDMGDALSISASMSSLIRTKQGKFSIDDAYTLDDISNNNFKLLKIEDVVDFPVIEVNDDLAFKISNGVSIYNTFDIEDKVLFKYNSKLLGIYKSDGNMLKTWKNFNL